MKKPKKRYLVTQKTIQNYGDGEIFIIEKKHYTNGVSDKQAISRIMHRLGFNKWNIHQDYWGDGCRDEIFEAQCLE